MPTKGSIKRFTIKDFELMCTDHRDKSWDLLDKQYGFNEVDLPKAYTKRTGLCKVLFSDIIGLPFDIHAPEHIRMLLEQVRADVQVQARVTSFFYYHYTAPDTVLDDLYDPTVVSVPEFESKRDRRARLIREMVLPELPEESSEHNPYRPSAYMHKVFEYMLQFNGPVELFAGYTHKVLCHIGEPGAAHYVLICQMKARCKKYGISITSQRDMEGVDRFVVTKVIGSRAQYINNIDIEELEE